MLVVSFQAMEKTLDVRHTYAVAFCTETYTPMEKDINGIVEVNLPCANIIKKSYVMFRYFIIHQKVIGGRLFCFVKIEIWRAFPGPI